MGSCGGVYGGLWKSWMGLDSRFQARKAVTVQESMIWALKGSVRLWDWELRFRHSG